MATETIDDLLAQSLENWTLAEIAAKAGISVRALHDIRVGKSAPRRATLLLLALTLRVPPDRLAAAVEATRAQPK